LALILVNFAQIYGWVTNHWLLLFNLKQPNKISLNNMNCNWEKFRYTIVIAATGLYNPVTNIT